MRSTCLFFVCGAAIALSAAAGPSTARAEPLVCRITGAGADGVPTYRCGGLVSCESALECNGETFGPTAVCQAYDERAPEAFCRAACATIVGCDSETDCPDFGGVAEPACVRFDASTGEPSGLCLYRGIGIHYCADIEEPAVLGHYWTTCHTRSDGTLTSNYFEGDCDGDGCANGDDSTPCIAGEAPCVFGTRGRLCDAMTMLDAGVPGTDAGASDDGGAIAPDAAPNEEDAGAAGDFDAGGGTTMDAGTMPPGVGFNGGGGCRCAAPGGGRASTGAALLALVLLATIRARRSRR